MKKLISLIILSALLVVSCTPNNDPKTGETKSETKVESPEAKTHEAGKPDVESKTEESSGELSNAEALPFPESKTYQFYKKNFDRDEYSLTEESHYEYGETKQDQTSHVHYKNGISAVEGVANQMGSVMLYKKGQVFVLNPEKKEYFILAGSEADTGLNIKMSQMNALSKEKFVKGRGKLGDKEYDTENLSFSGMDYSFFLDGDKVIGFRQELGGSFVEIRYKDIKDKANEALMEIPADYTEVPNPVSQSPAN